MLKLVQHDSFDCFWSKLVIPYPYKIRKKNFFRIFYITVKEKKMNITNLKYIPPKNNAYKIRTTYSPKKLYDMMKMYTENRNEKHKYLNILDYMLSTMLRGCGLRVIETPKGEMLAAYTYKMRKNRLEEKSMFIDGIARNFSTEKNQISKNLMSRLYEDIKKTAQKKKAKEITLFVYAKEKGLRKNYEKLGFKEDLKFYMYRVCLMRVRTENFLNNLHFKYRKYKETINLYKLQK